VQGNPKLLTRATEAIKFRSGNLEMLPTRFRNPRDHSLGGKLTKRDSGQTKTADEAPSASALETAIDEPGRTGIPRKLGEPFIVVLRL
jgi:hypothetical protein